MKGKISVFFFILAILRIILSSRVAAVEAPKNYYNVNNFDVKGDGQSDDTRAIQKTIDTCSLSGGGTVYFPPGKFLSGSLHLKSNVALYLDHGATILASPDDADFDPYEKLDFPNDADHETSFFHFALIWGEDIERIAILGNGTIDANRKKRGGPKPIAFKRCKYVDIKGITILNAPNYAISMLGTDYVNIDGVSILNGYCDGIDPDCCHHVRISNCHIETWDDAIVPKTSYSLGSHRSTEYLTVTNCQLATNSNAFKLGTESGGDFKSITVSNCVLFDRPNMRPPISGISLESVDGSHIDGVTITNISMINVRAPIFLRLGNRGRDMETSVPGTLQNVTISNIVATGAELTCPITGIPGHKINNVTLENININYKGSELFEQTIKVPENEGKYPSAKMFAHLPAYGLYCRHVAGLKLRNLKLSFSGQDLRHSIFCDDVINLDIESLTAQQARGGESIIKFNNVQDALIKGGMPSQGTGMFLRIAGTQSKGINLIGNDFSWVKHVQTSGEKVQRNIVSLKFNIMPHYNHKTPDRF